MKQHPILFSTPMVQAILEGRKTQTRRIMKFCKMPDYRDLELAIEPVFRELKTYDDGTFRAIFDTNEDSFSEVCRYGHVGDILWVRETWTKALFTIGGESTFLYKATEGKVKLEEGGFAKYKPNIHMPKVACRIWLQVTDIRVERLQSINEQDAIEEGALTITPSDDLPAVVRYHMLWDIINGPDSWNQNPFVWVIEFKKIAKP